MEALRQKVEIEFLQKRLKQTRAQLPVGIRSIENRLGGIDCEENMKGVFDRLRKNGVMSLLPATAKASAIKSGATRKKRR